MQEAPKRAPALVASGLGWPEGPARLPDGRPAFVESRRSRSSADGAARRFAPVMGAPNSCARGSDGAPTHPGAVATAAPR
jgi:gluconolactonase